MNIFEWEDGMSVTASDMNDMQNILNNNITNAIANQVVFTNGGNEVPTGRIIDGKREYVKRIDLGNLPNATYKDVDLGFSVLSLTKIEGEAYRSSDDVHFPLPFITTNVNNQIGLWLQGSNKLRVITGSNRSDLTAHADIYFTMEG